LIGVTVPLFAELQLPAVRKAAAWIARYSYGIYLTHLHAQWTAFIVLKDYPAAVRYSVLAVLSIGLPIALYHLIEAPMVKMGGRLADRLPKPAEKILSPVPSGLQLPAPDTAPGGYGLSHQPARQRSGHSSDHRTAKTAPARASVS
jgi:peptidoglycan/LPS O-acetylase OafA/YrhL